jgi:hypothetical protein
MQTVQTSLDREWMNLIIVLAVMVTREMVSTAMMWTSVQQTLTIAMTTQLVQTLMDLTLVLVDLNIKGMDSHALKLVTVVMDWQIV